MKLPILVKICPVIEILTFNKWSLKLTVSRSVLSYLRSMELTDVSTQHRIGKTKANKLVFSTEDLVLVKVLCQEKRLRQLMNNHTASLEINGNVQESVFSRKLVFWMSD